LDNAILVGPNIDAGKRLLQALDIAKIKVDAAFWFYREASEDWRLYIATPLVQELGPRMAYSKVLDVLREERIQDLDFWKLSVVDVTDSLVTVLRLAVSTDAGISDISVNGNSVNGVYIRAAHIYRMHLTS
jgi:hypothetical protein